MQRKTRKTDQWYEILAPIIAARGAKVKAASIDEACKRFHSKNAGEPVRGIDVACVPFDDLWSDPSCEGQEWIVAPAKPSERDPNVVMIWDGKTVKTYVAKEIVGKFFPQR